MAWSGLAQRRVSSWGSTRGEERVSLWLGGAASFVPFAFAMAGGKVMGISSPCCWAGAGRQDPSAGRGEP